MHIAHIEIGNFRKLRSVRIDFSEDRTVFVGANNSGKSSAMVALHRFLTNQSAFSINDITLCHWTSLNASGNDWEAAQTADQPIPVLNWAPYLPFLDIWLHVAGNELDRVQKLLPSLDFAGGLLGARLRLEPKDPAKFQHEYLKARADVKEALASVVPVPGGGVDAPAAAEPIQVSIWPPNIMSFLEKTLHGQFAVHGYLLDPAKLVAPSNGFARPQELDPDSEPVDAPLKGLIRIDEITAQRGFGQATTFRSSTAATTTGGGILSNQLKAYYDGHLDPSRKPRGHDVRALAAIEEAQQVFDARLKECFAAALGELEDLGYPGVTDPKLTVATRIDPAEGLNHDSAVQYEVASPSGTPAKLMLPEDSNGLGYQNLVSMVFRLMSFRDAWMKAGKSVEDEEEIPPLHLVLVEEPEAHLHAQVQQVFIKKAYSILRNHTNLKDQTALRTQLVVSTHSSHVAHECEFETLRYFRRMAAATDLWAVPLSSVVNLGEVFGGNGLTERFTRRYLKATHCDLFFADGAVLLEGPAERILVPHLVHERPAYEFLRKCYVTWLEIGGSHAHRLRPLIEHLGLPTLIIADIDAKEGTSESSVQPRRGLGQRTRNQTLKTWVPAIESLDELLDKPAGEKEKRYDTRFSIRAAYQSPMQVTFKSQTPAEALANTFEDALVYQNMEVFRQLPGFGLVAKFRAALADAVDLADLGAKMFADLKNGEKAVFALDLLELESTEAIQLPTYIHEGLLWLADQLKRRQEELTVDEPVTENAVAA